MCCDIAHSFVIGSTRRRMNRPRPIIGAELSFGHVDICSHSVVRVVHGPEMFGHHTRVVDVRCTQRAGTDQQRSDRHSRGASISTTTDRSSRASQRCSRASLSERWAGGADHVQTLAGAGDCRANEHALQWTAEHALGSVLDV